jgi:hypothetical protein
VERRVRGRRKGGRCVVRRKRGTGCRTYMKLKGGFAYQGKPGGNSFRFSGRLRGKKLRAGSYRLVATPTDAAGNHGSAARANFRILK